MRVLTGDSAVRVRPHPPTPQGPGDPSVWESTAIRHGALSCPPVSPAHPDPAMAWHRARRLPAGAEQAGLRPAVPGGRKPGQWALVPCPQAPGQHLRLSAGLLPTLRAPQGLSQGRQDQPLQGAPLP